MSIGVCHPDRYAVEETFQLLKVPWEWYVPGRHYDVVIASKADVPDYSGNLIDLTANDFFKQISNPLNNGQSHLHEPACDLLLDTLRQELIKYTILIEIPPAPWGHPYMVALTHDVDVTSVKECRIVTAGYAALQCISQGAVSAGLRLCLAHCGIGHDPWALFERWKMLEEQMGIRSTFFFIPEKNKPGARGHPYRMVGYDIKVDVLRNLILGGWEVGVHGIDNWTDVKRGKQEMAALGLGVMMIGNRTHWLMFDKNSWNVLDEAGYSYDTTFGYNDDAGFRAGTMQVFRPRGVKNLLELPLHIQDLGLFGKFCWAPTENGWAKISCLHLDEHTARMYCNRIFDYAKKFGGVVTVLWHYENLTPPHNWTEIYTYLVKHAQADGAWVTTAGAVVEWFKVRRAMGIEYDRNENIIMIKIRHLNPGQSPPTCVRIHIDPAQISHINNEHRDGDGYIDIACTRPEIMVALT
jgi:hypothetical protein